LIQYVPSISVIRGSSVPKDSYSSAADSAGTASISKLIPSVDRAMRRCEIDVSQVCPSTPPDFHLAVLEAVKRAMNDERGAMSEEASQFIAHRSSFIALPSI